MQMVRRPASHSEGAVYRVPETGGEVEGDEDVGDKDRPLDGHELVALDALGRPGWVEALEALAGQCGDRQRGVVDARGKPFGHCKGSPR